SGYESTDSETEDQKRSNEYNVPVNRQEIGHVSARVKSTHSLCESLKLIMEIPELCDVTFLVGPKEIPVYGVRAILGTRSKVLYQLIIKHLNLREAELKYNKPSVCGGRLTIPVRKYDTEVFRMLIQFVHSGTATITDTAVFGLLCGAYQFELRDLEEACWEYIGRRIEHGCVDVILTSARAYKQHRNANEIYNTIYFSLEKQKRSAVCSSRDRFV
ncbi:serine-enriched protein-like, partial [Ruditapes philippinarum]|uniref:serine-enriched protein-like n=1 Tax=Ruditapes philippinarum TaxID=129788 RepID=UPI00295A586C